MGVIRLNTNPLNDYNIEDEYSHSSEMLSTIFDLNPDAIVLTRASDGKIIDCNNEFLYQIGYSRDEVIGHTSLELDLYSLEARVNYVSKIRENNIISNFEVVLKRKNGNLINILYSARFININNEEIILNIGKDITERKKTEEKLKISEARFRSVLKNSIDVIYRFNLQTGKYEYMSPSIKKLNFEPEDMMKMTNEEVLSRVHPDDRPLLIHSLSTINKTGIGQSEYRFKGKDDKYLWWSNQIVITNDSEGKPLYRDGFVRDITQYKQIEQQLQTNLKRFYTILSSLYGAILIVSNDDKIEYVNQAFCDLFNLDKSNLELTVFNASEFIDLIKSRYQYPDKAIIRIKEIVDNGKPVKGEEVNFNNGKTCMRDYIPIKINGKSYGRIWHHMDITERKRSEMIIERHGIVLEGINQIFQQAFTCETEEEVVSKCLEVAEKITKSKFGFYGEINDKGRLDDRALSAPAWEVCETPNAAKLLKNMKIRSYWGRTIKDEKSQIVNDPASDPDSLGLPEGHPLITSFLGVPLKEGEKTIGMIALANKTGGYSEEDSQNVETLSVAFVEALMRKRAEIKLKENIKNFARSNQELEQFAYITSHDLREPLRMITSFLQLLERRYKDELDQDANEFINFAVEGAKRLDNMINDLLQYSQISSKGREFKPIMMEYVLDQVLINLKIPIDENKALIYYDHLPLINGDEKLMLQLFQNLIGNAIKYRSKERPIIHISAKKEKDKYLFTVSDNGIGISPDYLDRIFTIFQRLHTHEEYERTGIGLAIAQKIVHQHAGQIWVESEIGKGTAFHFTIPSIIKLGPQ